MLNTSIDLGAHVMVVSVAGDDTSDRERLYAAIEELDRSGREQGRAIAMVLVVAPDAPPPDAYWRRRFAEQRKTLRSPRVFVSVVTGSAVMRGVLTAMNWIAPEPSHVKSLPHATFEEGATWIERVHGTSRTVLRRLLEDAQSNARENERPVESS